MASGKIKTADTVVCALFAAIICVISPWSLPISGEVPRSLATAAIYLASACAGWKRGTVSVLLYIVIGALGVPVFSSFRGGLSVIAGPTGGYIIGYLPCAFICGFIIDRIGNGKKAAAYPAGMIAGTVILYAVGTAWYMFITKNPLIPSLAGCVLPFLPGDAAKIAAASLLGYELRKRVISGRL